MGCGYFVLILFFINWITILLRVYHGEFKKKIAALHECYSQFICFFKKGGYSKT